ncbi:MAG: NAD(P)H-dependent oxidoreductase [Leptolyngbyaceae cyanobacterium bins.302]|nr:NAD(P)H-dependent oxidoreductase [Leptolyngbyaceae cyanobacterium bins.302]
MSDTVISSKQLLQQLHWRYATKKFDSTKKIPEDLWRTLEESLVLAPSSFGLQPWKFFVITDLELRQKLVEHSWGQQQVADASHLVVFAIKKELTSEDVDRYIDRIAEVRQVPLDSLQGFSNVIKGFLEKPPVPPAEWATRQVYIALGQFMTSAALLGIDTCPMEGFIPPKYNEILNLEVQGYSAVVLCPAGYRAEDDNYATLPKVRYPNEAVIDYIAG